jgi:ubiquinone/menaquinone biosynthesis C-methylase UbiE
MRKFAENYDEVLVPVIFQPWARELIRRAPPWSGMRFLDLACGTGAVTREIIATGVKPESLTGVDLTAGMLSVASERSRALGIEVSWVEADATSLPLPDSSFDLAYCQQALQFFPDPVGALKELRRVLVDGAPVAFCISTELTENPLLLSQVAAMEEHIGEQAGASVRAICSLTDASEIRLLFEKAGFKSIDVEKVNLKLFHPDGRAYATGAMGGMHTGDKLAQLTVEQRETCFDDFLTGLGEFFDGRALEFPHVSNVVTARA